MKLFNVPPAKRKSLLVLPLIVLPGICLIFFSLGGGQDGLKVSGLAALGVNLQLPKASVEGRQLLNKKLQYEQAERDSLRKARFRMQDPYRRDSSMSRPVFPMGSVPSRGISGRVTAKVTPQPLIASDSRADQLLAKLEQLRQTNRRPMASELPSPHGVPSFPGRMVSRRALPSFSDDTVGDAKVGRLNDLLDKVIRIRHPEEARPSTAAPLHVDEVLPADSGANAISVVVADNQVLVAGMTIALRITDSVRVNGSLLKAGQMVFGTVSVNGDRMLVHIGAIRYDRSLYTTDFQVYDLDGIAGIHIPGVLSRDVAKESADQGVSSLNVLNVDPSLGAQAASAGIQTVKTFASRKVKQVRVSLPAGYQLLLRDPHARGSRRGFADVAPVAVVATPDFIPTGKAVSSCRNEGVELELRGIWLLDGRLWFGLSWANHSAIAYTPGYIRWLIRDRRQVRRTAAQELPLEPLSAPPTTKVEGDSTSYTWTGFVPFALAKDKELVLEVGEQGGGRMLSLRLNYKTILNIKRESHETR
jgi:Conjugative transposon, TraM/Domain of unknown function (DUF4138)